MMGRTPAEKRAFFAALKLDPEYADDPEFQELFDAAIELIAADQTCLSIPRKYIPLIERYADATVRLERAKATLYQRNEHFRGRLASFLEQWQKGEIQH